jgi:hypothetical protein
VIAQICTLFSTRFSTKCIPPVWHFSRDRVAFHLMTTHFWICAPHSNFHSAPVMEILKMYQIVCISLSSPDDIQPSEFSKVNCQVRGNFAPCACAPARGAFCCCKMPQSQTTLIDSRPHHLCQFCIILLRHAKTSWKLYTRNCSLQSHMMRAIMMSVGEFSCATFEPLDPSCRTWSWLRPVCPSKAVL